VQESNAMPSIQDIVEQAVDAAMNGDHQKAIDLIAMVIDRPELSAAHHAQALNVLGSAYAGLGDVERAIASHTAQLAIAEALDPPNGLQRGVAHLNRGRQLEASGRLGAAYADYAAAMACSPIIGKLLARRAGAFTQH
jgi:tetratricopeptide (TPR) repeat protein